MTKKWCHFGVIFGLLVYAPTYGEAATAYSLKDGTVACKTPQGMNLWDLSDSSPLIRHDLLKQDHCWRAAGGMKVLMLGKIGKFSQVQFPDNRHDFYVYSKDLKNWIPFKEKTPTHLSNVERSVTDIKIANTHEFGVTLIKKKPSVNIVLVAGHGMTINIGIIKEVIRSGWDAQITDQKGSEMQAGGKFKDQYLGFGRAGDYVKLQFLKVDFEKKMAEIEVEGRWGDVASVNVTLKPSRVIISGKNFVELVRPHTATELLKVIE